MENVLHIRDVELFEEMHCCEIEMTGMIEANFLKVHKFYFGHLCKLLPN